MAGLGAAGAHMAALRLASGERQLRKGALVALPPLLPQQVCGQPAQWALLAGSRARGWRRCGRVCADVGTGGGCAASVGALARRCGQGW